MSTTMWYAWTKEESGSDGFRNVGGDYGKAYGKYQFDYRYGLVPFLTYCVEKNSDHYSEFNEFIKLGAGSSELVNNDSLKSVWLKLCDKYPTEFENLQDSKAYADYYLLVKKYIKTNTGIDLETRHAVVKGSAFSMAIYSGPSGAAKKFKGCNTSMSDEEILIKAYESYGTDSNNRWTKDKQLGYALEDLKNDVYTLIDDNGIPIINNEKQDNSTEQISTREAWFNVVKEVKKQYAENSGGGHYSQDEYVSISLNGKKADCRLDCSGYVSACLYFFGAIDKSGLNNSIYQDKGVCMKYTKFTHYGWPGSWDKINVGDIMSNENHTQIFAGIVNGQPTAYSVGSDKSAANSGPTMFNSTPDYIDFWSPEYVEETTTVYYRVGTAWKNGKCENQVGAFTNSLNAIESCKTAAKSYSNTYYVFDEDGNVIWTATPSTLYRVGTDWSSDKCVEQKGAFTSLKNAKSCADANKNLNKKSFYVYNESGYVVYEAIYNDPTIDFYRVGTAWKNGKCKNQVGAFKDIRNATSTADSFTKKTNKIYYVFNPAGKTVYTGKK